MPRWIALIGAALVAWVLVSPTPGYPIDPDALLELAKRAGLPEDVGITLNIHTHPYMVNGKFEHDMEHGNITVLVGTQTPDDLVTYIFLHEIEHAKHWKASPSLYWLRRISAATSEEWDADAGAVNTLCSWGRDGIGIMRRAFEQMTRYFGYVGDAVHGRPEARLEYARDHAPACGATPVRGAM